jgi:DNA-binding NarL/FixJ family response regulator
MQRFLARFALSECDQLRVLICDGPRLLAWVGAFRAGRFGRDDAELLGSIVPSLQRRLAMERSMAEVQHRASEIAAALERVPAAAFVLGKSGSVLDSNEAGRAMLDRDRRAVEAQLPASKPVALDAQSDLQLAVIEARGDVSPRVTAARARWQLTQRQAEVLRLVGQGYSNKAAGRALRCTESTVELHVSALMQKSRSRNRAELVARLWSGT